MLKYTDVSVVFREIPDEIVLAINISNCPYKCKGCHSPELWGDIGDELNEDVLDKLVEKNKGITVVCFMGEGKDSESVKQLSNYVREKYGLKIGLYTGKTEIGEEYNDVFDYIKIGPYIEELGPLSKPTTNQRMYKIVNGEREDITSKFWR